MFEGGLAAPACRHSPKTPPSESFSAPRWHSTTSADLRSGAPASLCSCSRVSGFCLQPPASPAVKRTPAADLLLAGRLHMVDVIARCLVAVAASALVISAAVGAGLVRPEPIRPARSSTPPPVLGVTLTFATAGLLAAQVMPTRSTAVGVTVGVPGRLPLHCGCSPTAPQRLAWLGWTTPFGLAARAAPYADNRVVPLLVLAAFPIAFAAAGLLTARHRDVGRRTGRGGDAPSTPHRLLGSVTGFAIRRAIPPTMAWGPASSPTSCWSARSSRRSWSSSTPIATSPIWPPAAGFAGLDSANGFAAALFSLLAIPTGLYAATRLAAMVADEKARRWTPGVRHRHVANSLGGQRDRGGHRRGGAATCGRRAGHLGRRRDHRSARSRSGSTGRRAEFGADRLARGRGRRPRSRLATVRSRSRSVRYRWRAGSS